MKVLVTGSSGHLGEALMRTLRSRDGYQAMGIDIAGSAWTDRVGSIADRGFVDSAMLGCDAVLHTATLHKPHVATHTRQQFIDTNVSGTLNLLEAAAVQGVQAFVFTSTTSTYGDAMVPADDRPAVWIDEHTVPLAKNIYGATKLAAEDLCRLAARNQKLPCIVLRTSRFFPEPDDDAGKRGQYADANIKINELLYRRADVEDLVEAHLLALRRAADIGFARYLLSATTPFSRDEAAELHRDAAAVLARHVPAYLPEYARRGWRMFPRIERVYDNALARRELGWHPRHDFAHAIDCLRRDQDPRSDLAKAIGIKGYHDGAFADGLYPVG